MPYSAIAAGALRHSVKAITKPSMSAFLFGELPSLRRRSPGDAFAPRTRLFHPAWSQPSVAPRVHAPRMRPRPVQPPDPSLEAFTRQLAARFAKEPSAPGKTAPYVAPARDEPARMAEPARAPKVAPRATDPGKRPPRGRALALSFLLGAAAATVCTLYFLYRAAP